MKPLFSHLIGSSIVRKLTSSKVDKFDSLRPRTLELSNFDVGERRSAFTIVEVLTVVSIIAILLGMVGAASHTARQKAYRAQAETEVREIANACRAFWIASGSWKDGHPYWPGSSGEVDKKLCDVLAGDNPAKAVFLQIDEARFDEEGKYCDPWGQPYEITFKPPTSENKITHHFKTSATFPMRNRNTYYGKEMTSLEKSRM